MPAGLPDLRRHDDGRFETDNIVALAGHGVPPEFLDVALEFRAQRAVVPKAVDPAVDFRGLEDEPAAFAQGDNFLHQVSGFGFGHRAGRVLENAGAMSRSARLAMAHIEARRNASVGS